MFDQLSERLQGVLSDVRSRGKLSEDDVNKALREVRLALLEADVNFKVVKDFTAALKERLAGEEISEALNPGQTVVKAVNDELTTLMGGSGRDLVFAPSGPTVILMSGLQGSGKTTATAKLAKLLGKQNKDVAVAACDLQRPAAVEQLEKLGAQANAHVYSQPGETDAVKVAKWARDQAVQENRDVLIVDTAGRLHVDQELMDELAEVRKVVKPHDVLLVVDAMTGQDAVNVAESFAEVADFDGVVITKLDGDARGGAALSVRAVTGKPIMYGSTGEKLDELERFHPDRMAGRILGMGDVMSLIEKTQDEFDEDEAADLERKIRKQQFTLDDFLTADETGAEDGPARQPDEDGAGDGQGDAGHGPGRRAGARPARGDHPVDDAVRACPPGRDQRFAPQADRARLRNDGPGRQPPGQAVRSDEQADEAALRGQDARRSIADAWHAMSVSVL